jgi:hypothetical protein
MMFVLIRFLRLTSQRQLLRSRPERVLAGIFLGRRDYGVLLGFWQNEAGKTWCSGGEFVVDVW